MKKAGYSQRETKIYKAENRLYPAKRTTGMAVLHDKAGGERGI